VQVDQELQIEAAVRDQATDAHHVVTQERSIGGDLALLTAERAVEAISQVVEADTQSISPQVMEAMAQTLT
jgi:hypothetical protein